MTSIYDGWQSIWENAPPDAKLTFVVMEILVFSAFLFWYYYACGSRARPEALSNVPSNRYTYFVPKLGRLITFRSNVLIDTETIMPVEQKLVEDASAPSDIVRFTYRRSDHSIVCFHASTIPVFTRRYCSTISFLVHTLQHPYLVEQHLQPLLTNLNVPDRILHEWIKYISGAENTWLTSGDAIARSTAQDKQHVLRLVDAMGVPYLKSLWSGRESDRYALTLHDWWIRQMEIYTYCSFSEDTSDAYHPIFGRLDPAFHDIKPLFYIPAFSFTNPIVEIRESSDPYGVIYKPGCVNQVDEKQHEMKRSLVDPKSSLEYQRLIRHSPPHDLFVIGSSVFSQSDFESLWVISTTQHDQLLAWYKSVMQHPVHVSYDSINNEWIWLRPYPYRAIRIRQTYDPIIRILCRQYCDCDAVAFHLSTSQFLTLARAQVAYASNTLMLYRSIPISSRPQYLRHLCGGFTLAVPGFVKELLHCAPVPEPSYITSLAASTTMDLLDFIYMAECNASILQFQQQRHMYAPNMTPTIIQLWNTLPLRTRHGFYSRAFNYCTSV